MNGGSRNSKNQWQKRGRSWQSVEGTITKEFLLSQLYWTEDGASGLTGTPTMLTPVLLSSLVKQLERSCFLAFGTNFVQHVRETFHETNTDVTGTGRHHLLRWRPTLSWRGFSRQSGYMEFATQNSLVMAIALCTRLSSRVFQDGAMPSRNSSAPTMHANATGVRSRGSSRTTPPTRVVVVSQQR